MKEESLDIASSFVVEWVGSFALYPCLQDAREGKFKAVSGKYELIETDNVDPEAALALSNNLANRTSSSARGPKAPILPCKLDAPTKELVELVFRCVGPWTRSVVDRFESSKPQERCLSVSTRPARLCVLWCLLLPIDPVTPVPTHAHLACQHPTCEKHKGFVTPRMAAHRLLHRSETLSLYACARRILVEHVISEDMFKSAMSNMNVDVRKMPLGQLSKAQASCVRDLAHEP